MLHRIRINLVHMVLIRSFLLVGRILNISVNGRTWDTLMLLILTILMIFWIAAMVCLARSIMFYVSWLRGIRSENLSFFFHTVIAIVSMVVFCGIYRIRIWNESVVLGITEYGDHLACQI
jgi:hypothetical protein